MAGEHHVIRARLLPDDQARYEELLGAATLCELRLAFKLQNLALSGAARGSRSGHVSTVDPAPIYLFIAVSLSRSRHEREEVTNMLRILGLESLK